MSAQAAASAALWQAMVEHAEALNDAVVIGQRRADARVAGAIAARAQEIAALATAVQILRRQTGARS